MPLFIIDLTSTKSLMLVYIVSDLCFLSCRYGALTPLNFLEGIQRPPSWVKHMRFNTEEDYEKYFSRMRAVETMINQGIFLMKRAIELNRTNHEVSMVSIPCFKSQRKMWPAINLFYHGTYI